jgi:hypothetical protein
MIIQIAKGMKTITREPYKEGYGTQCLLTVAYGGVELERLDESYILIPVDDIVEWARMMRPSLFKEVPTPISVEEDNLTLINSFKLEDDEREIDE